MLLLLREIQSLFMFTVTLIQDIDIYIRHFSEDFVDALMGDE